MRRTRAEVAEILRIQTILDEIRFLDRKIVLMSKNGVLLLQVQFYARDVVSHRKKLQKCRKWFISEHMTETEVVQTAFAACLQSMEHETRENFVYKGQRVCSPHLSVAGRVKMCEGKDFDRRPELPGRRRYPNLSERPTGVLSNT